MKRSYRLVIALIAVVGAFCLTEPVLADPLEDGLAAYRRGDYATALSLLKPLAEQGDARAQAQLGIMYAEGKGVARDDSEALKWLRKAAEQDDPRGHVRRWKGRGARRRAGLHVASPCRHEFA